METIFSMQFFSNLKLQKMKFINLKNVNRLLEQTSKTNRAGNKAVGKQVCGDKVQALSVTLFPLLVILLNSRTMSFTAGRTN